MSFDTAKPVSTSLSDYANILTRMKARITGHCRRLADKIEDSSFIESITVSVTRSSRRELGTLQRRMSTLEEEVVRMKPQGYFGNEFILQGIEVRCLADYASPCATHFERNGTARCGTAGKSSVAGSKGCIPRLLNTC